MGFLSDEDRIARQVAIEENAARESELNERKNREQAAAARVAQEKFEADARLLIGQLFDNFRSAYRSGAEPIGSVKIASGPISKYERSSTRYTPHDSGSLKHPMVVFYENRGEIAALQRLVDEVDAGFRVGMAPIQTIKYGSDGGWPHLDAVEFTLSPKEPLD